MLSCPQKKFYIGLLGWIGFLLLPVSIGLPSKSELAQLDTFSKRYRVDRVIKKIKSTAYSPQTGFSFVVWGDNQLNIEIMDRLWEEIQQENALFAISTGDLVITGEAKEWEQYFIPVIERFRRTPFLSAIGNHDIGHERQEYIRIFGLTDYTFDYGNARFVVVDNNQGLSVEQLKWLESNLKSTTCAYKFVFAHQPPAVIEKWVYHAFSSGADSFCSLMQKYQVTMVFHGHIHAYSTSKFKGIQYIVTGGGGAQLERGFEPQEKVFHYCVVHVTPQKAAYEVVRLRENKMIRSPGENQ